MTDLPSWLFWPFESTMVQKAKEQNKARDAVVAAQKEAEQKALMETQAQDKVTAARKSLLDTPTSGFGPNTNLARSFLTSL